MPCSSDFGFADPGELLQPRVSGPAKCPSRRPGERVRNVAFLSFAAHSLSTSRMGVSRNSVIIGMNHPMRSMTPLPGGMLSVTD